MPPIPDDQNQSAVFGGGGTESECPHTLPRALQATPIPANDNVTAELLLLYPGEESGSAFAGVLFGTARPNQTIASWPLRRPLLRTDW